MGNPDWNREGRSAAAMREHMSWCEGEDDPASESSAPAPGGIHRVAIIGSGPRGISVLERMALRLANAATPTSVSIHLLDSTEVGCGRIWRTDQPAYLMMNTIADEITMFSGPPRAGEKAAPGAGPSLAQWWREQYGPDYPGPNSYAPRALYGKYLHFVLDTVERSLPPEVSLYRHRRTVVRLSGTQERGYRLRLDDGNGIGAERVVLTTGHAIPRLSGEARRMRAFAEQRPPLGYFSSGPVTEMPMGGIPAGAAVGVLGLGLTFFDVMAALTVGRGGRFSEAPDGRLEYSPSGREPRLYAGSRSGMLMPARGVNQKDVDATYEPVVFTEDRVAALKSDTGLEFVRDVFPWIGAEMELAATLAVNRFGADPGARESFVREVARAAGTAVPDVAAVAVKHGLQPGRAADLDALAQPFKNRSFPSPQAFHHALRQEVESDLREADLGNLDSARKASLDVLRDVRWLICRLVDFGSLSPSSHEHDFLGWYAARSSFLVSGPPRVRTRQALALMSAGVLHVLGPQASFAPDAESGRFIGGSAAVQGSDVLLDAVIDARVPVPDVRRDSSPLMVDLLARGAVQPFRNCCCESASEGGRPPDRPSGCRHGPQRAGFETGGVAVTRPPYHPTTRAGEADHGICVLGIPTEHTRWFMTMGGRRPGFWSQFDQDADDIAASVLRGACSASPVPAHAS